MHIRFGARHVIYLVVAGGAFLFSNALLAGEADVVAATVTKLPDGSYHFDVTVAHADTGWDHYANVWQVVGPDGVVLGERELMHPHVEEQPFTRSLSGVNIPADIKSIIIRAGDLVHGYGGQEVTLGLPSEAGKSVSSIK
ncbi:MULTISPECIES: hypothetical protein [Thalassospira]|uniref:Uncharacterized protein n=2 Tax=Thalassospira TaxID=168934 RepID=A0A367W6Z1_9PROT|nr:MULTISPECIES: hypothetical protein [Thalassospira]MDG4719299.1 hypothetical protein [Thalassospira sp. FZY0004]RCK37208.1 hypothetical protein TH19_11785 [Thalassospira profundimaris]